MLNVGHAIYLSCEITAPTVLGERERQEDGAEVKGGLGEGDDDDDDALTELREPLLEEL